MISGSYKCCRVYLLNRTISLIKCSEFTQQRWLPQTDELNEMRNSCEIFGIIRVAFHASTNIRSGESRVTNAKYVHPSSYYYNKASVIIYLPFMFNLFNGIKTVNRVTN